MVLGGKKLTIGALIVLGLGGALFYVTEPFGKQSQPQVVPTTAIPSPKNAHLQFVGPSPITTLKGSDRQEKDAKLEKVICKFEDALHDYLRAEEKRHQGKKITWKRYISGGASLSKEEKQKNKAIWEQYLGVWKAQRKLDVPMPVRVNIYRFLFDMPSLGATKDDLALMLYTDEWEEISFDYISEAINPAWYARYARGPIRTVECRKDDKFRAELPKRLLPFYDDPSDKETYEDNPNRGILHLVGYRKVRAEDFGGETIKALQKHMGDLQGKDFADLGSGCGFTLPLFRECIGPNAKLYACELDKYTLDVLNFTGSKYATIKQCLLDDCCLPENSVDIINMTGVHMGLFSSAKSQDVIDEHVRPWLKTMARALRPGGMLTINDGDWNLIDKGAQEVVESAGFETLDFIESENHLVYTFVFRVKK